MTNFKSFIASTFEYFRKSSSIAVVLMRRSIMERQRKHKFQHLGELTYALCKTNVIKDETLSELIEDIDSINSDIRKSSSELEDCTCK